MTRFIFKLQNFSLRSSDRDLQPMLKSKCPRLSLCLCYSFNNHVNIRIEETWLVVRNLHPYWKDLLWPLFYASIFNVSTLLRNWRYKMVDQVLVKEKVFTFWLNRDADAEEEREVNLCLVASMQNTSTGSTFTYQ
ncbi:hypothetical protein AgCh_019973 [Apium graveolens]